MSETAAPAPGVVTTADTGAAAPAPASAPAPAPEGGRLSLSEAARELAARRHEVARQNAAAQGPSAPAPAPAIPATPAAPPAAPAESTPSSYDTLAKALGLQPGAVPAANDAVPPVETAANDGVEIEGQRYSRDRLRTSVLQARDYTQKTQALAEAQRAIAEKEAALATVLQVIGPEYQALQQRIQSVQPPDQSLVDTNPQEYLRQFAAY